MSNELRKSQDAIAAYARRQILRRALDVRRDLKLGAAPREQPDSQAHSDAPAGLSKGQVSAALQKAYQSGKLTAREYQRFGPMIDSQGPTRTFQQLPRALQELVRQESGDNLAKSMAEVDALGRVADLQRMPNLQKSHVSQALYDAVHAGELSPEEYRRLAPLLDARGIRAVLPDLPLAVLSRVREQADELGRLTAEVESCNRSLELLHDVPTLKKSHVGHAIREAVDAGELSREEYRRLAPALDSQGVGGVLPHLPPAVQDRVREHAEREARGLALAVPVRPDGSRVSKSDVGSMLSAAFDAGLITRERFGELLRQLNTVGVERMVAELPKKLRARLGLAD